MGLELGDDTLGGEFGGGEAGDITCAMVAFLFMRFERLSQDRSFVLQQSCIPMKKGRCNLYGFPKLLNICRSDRGVIGRRL